MFLALTLAVAAVLVAGIAVPAYFRFTWFRNSVRDNAPHYLTAMFTLLLVVFACYAWLEGRRGSAALEGQLAAMQADQKPLLWLIGTDPRPEFVDATHQFRWTWLYANIGKGIAYQVVARDYPKIGNERYQRSRYLNGVPLQSPPPIILPPYVPLSLPRGLMRW
jgi:hypothetical protein